MGVIWAATHLANGERVALKLLRPGTADDASTRRRLVRSDARGGGGRSPERAIHPRRARARQRDAVPRRGSARGRVAPRQAAARGADPPPRAVAHPAAGHLGRRHRARAGHRPPRPEARQHLPAHARRGRATRLARRSGRRRRGAPERHARRRAGSADSPAAAQHDARVRVLDFGIAKVTAAHGETAGRGGAPGPARCSGPRTTCRRSRSSASTTWITAPTSGRSASSSTSASPRAAHRGREHGQGDEARPRPARSSRSGRARPRCPPTSRP